MELLIKISIVLLIGVLGGRIAKLLHLPNVTGYLMGGLLIGPSLLNVLTEADIQDFSIINEIALAAIAFSIGREFKVEDLMKTGKKIFIITLFESLTAVIIVFFASYVVLNQSFQFSILIGAIAAATAPAATIMVINQYKANGPLTKTILPVVAIDDAVSIICFGVALAIAKVTLGKTDMSLFQMISAPIIEILGSILFGFILGFILTLLSNKADNQRELLTLVLAFVIAAAGLTRMLHLSALLTCMMLGATVTNLMHNSQRVFNTLNDFTSPIYLFFFTLAGASLHINILMELGAVGIVYILARAAGKMLGAATGARLVGSSDVVTKYLGLGLLPQAGVAIGLSMIIRQQIPEIGIPLTAVVLGGVLIYELVGPVLAKLAIEKAGEINKLEVSTEQA